MKRICVIVAAIFSFLFLNSMALADDAPIVEEEPVAEMINMVDVYRENPEILKEKTQPITDAKCLATIADSVSIRTLVYEASMLKARMPNIEEIYVVDSRPGLAGDYKNAIKKNSIESYAIFKDLITKSGIKLL